MSYGGIKNMSPKQAKDLAHELTIKYIEINRNVLNDPSLSNVPKMVEEFADINKKFYDAIMKNEVLSNLL